MTKPFQKQIDQGRESELTALRQRVAQAEEQCKRLAFDSGDYSMILKENAALREQVAGARKTMLEIEGLCAYGPNTGFVDSILFMAQAALKALADTAGGGKLPIDSDSENGVR